MGKVIRMI